MDFSQLRRSSSGVKFLNLDDACEAEVDILQDMLFTNQDDSQLSNLFHLKSYPDGEQLAEGYDHAEGAGGDESGRYIEEDVGGVIENCNAESEHHQIDMSQDQHRDPSAMSAEAQIPMANGPLMPISPQHHGDMNPPMIPTIPQMRGYYSQSHVPVVHGAASGSVGATPMGQPHGMVNAGYPHVSVAISQVNQQQFLMMQSQAGQHYMPVHYVQQHRHQGHPHNYVQGEPLSPEFVQYLHNPNLTKIAHDPSSQSLPHSHPSNASLQGGPTKYSNGSRKGHARSGDRNRRADQEMMNNYSAPAYYPTNLAYPTNMAYYNQQLAPTLTGSPIIMSAPHGKPTVAMYNYTPHQYSSPPASVPASITPQPSPSEAQQSVAETVDATQTSTIPEISEVAPSDRPGELLSHDPSHGVSSQSLLENAVPSQLENQTHIHPSNEQVQAGVEFAPQEGMNDATVVGEASDMNAQIQAPLNQNTVTVSSFPQATVAYNSSSQLTTENVGATTTPTPGITNQEVRKVSEPSAVPDIAHRKTTTKCPSPTINEARQSSAAVQGATTASATANIAHSQPPKVQTWAEHSAVKPHRLTQQSTVTVSVNSGSSSNSITNSNGTNLGTSIDEKTLKEKPGQKAADFPALANNNSVNGSSVTNVSNSSNIPNNRSWASVCKKPNHALPHTGHNSGDSATSSVIHSSSAGQSHESQTQSAISFSNGNSEKSLSQSPSSDNNVPTNVHGDRNKLSTASGSVSSEAYDPSCLNNENDTLALRLGEFLVNYQLDHHATALTPRGLTNQSNFCYINATLQALMACPPFVNLFRSMRDIGLAKTPCKATPIIQSVFDFVSEFEPLNRGNTNKRDRRSESFITGSNLEPTGIRKVLDLLDGSTYKIEGRQQDAEEFLSHLLNGLHDEMIKVMKWHENSKVAQPSVATHTPDVANGVHGAEGFHEDDDDADHWQVMGPKNKGCLTRKTNVSKSPISEMLFGQLCSALHRINAVKSATLQPFFTLQLDIQNDSIRSVRDALDGLSSKEEVSGLVSQSGQETEAWRVLSLEELPMILILHLKRFVYDKSGNKIQKLDKRLEFGIDLEITKDLLSPNVRGKCAAKQRQYKLFAVVYHDGEEAYKGHYIADCFHPSGGNVWGSVGWLRYDDVSVKPIAENAMLNSQPPRVPYLLYYRRADTLVSHTQIPRKERPRNFGSVDS